MAGKINPIVKRAVDRVKNFGDLIWRRRYILIALTIGCAVATMLLVEVLGVSVSDAIVVATILSVWLAVGLLGLMLRRYVQRLRAQIELLQRYHQDVVDAQNARIDFLDVAADEKIARKNVQLTQQLQILGDRIDTEAKLQRALDAKNIKKVYKDIQGIELKISELSGDFDNAVTSVNSTVSAGFRQFELNQATVEAKVETLNENINGLSSQQSALEKEVSGALSEVNDVRNDAQTSKEELSYVLSEIDVQLDTLRAHATRRATQQARFERNQKEQHSKTDQRIDSVERTINDAANDMEDRIRILQNSIKQQLRNEVEEEFSKAQVKYDRLLEDAREKISATLNQLSQEQEVARDLLEEFELNAAQQAELSDERIQSFIDRAGEFFEIEQQKVESKLLEVEEQTVRSVERISAEQRQELAKFDSKIEASTASSHTNIEQLRAHFSRTEAQLNQLKSEARKLISSKTAELEPKIDTVEAAVETLTDYAGRNQLHRRFNRVLTRNNLHVFLQRWNKILGLNLTGGAISYYAERLEVLESHSAGRIATSVEDALLRAIVALSLPKQRISILEIGTLFGIGLIFINEIVSQKYKSVNLTAIDPLDGYYGSSRVDTLVGIPVNEENLLSNIKKAGINRNKFRLLKGYSYEPEILSEAASKKYDVIVIDGDHTYSGVKADVENYLPMLDVGGFLIIDDYQSDDWPEVTKYADGELLPRTDVAIVGAQWRTLIVKKIKTTQESKNSKSD